MICNWDFYHSDCVSNTAHKEQASKTLIKIKYVESQNYRNIQIGRNFWRSSESILWNQWFCVDEKPAMCTYRLEGQLYLGLHQKRGGQEGDGWDCPSFALPSWDPIRSTVSSLGTLGVLEHYVAVLNISRKWHSATSMGNLYQCLVVLVVNNFFNICRQKFTLSTWWLSLMLSLCTLVKEYHQLVNSCLSHNGILWSHRPCTSFSLKEMQFLQTSFMCQVLQLTDHLMVFQWTLNSCFCDF